LNFLEDTAKGAQHPALLDPCLWWPVATVTHLSYCWALVNTMHVFYFISLFYYYCLLWSPYGI